MKKIKSFMDTIPNSPCKNCDNAMRLDRDGNVCCEYNCKCLNRPLGMHTCPAYCKNYKKRGNDCD